MNTKQGDGGGMAASKEAQYTAEDIRREIERRKACQVQAWRLEIQEHEQAIRTLSAKIQKICPDGRVEASKRESPATRAAKILKALQAAQEPLQASDLIQLTGLKRMAFLMTAQKLLQSSQLVREGKGRGVLYSLPSV